MRFEILTDTGSLRVDNSIIDIAYPRAQVEKQLVEAGFTLDEGHETRLQWLWRRSGGVDYALHFGGKDDGLVSQITLSAYPEYDAAEWAAWSAVAEPRNLANLTAILRASGIVGRHDEHVTCVAGERFAWGEAAIWRDPHDGTHSLIVRYVRGAV